MTKEFVEDMVKLTSFKDPVYDEVMKAVGNIQPQKMVTQFNVIFVCCDILHYICLPKICCSHGGKSIYNYNWVVHQLVEKSFLKEPKALLIYLIDWLW